MGRAAAAAWRNKSKSTAECLETAEMGHPGSDRELVAEGSHLFGQTIIGLLEEFVAVQLRRPQHGGPLGEGAEEGGRGRVQASPRPPFASATSGDISPGHQHDGAQGRGNTTQYGVAGPPGLGAAVPAAFEIGSAEER